MPLSSLLGYFLVGRYPEKVFLSRAVEETEKILKFQEGYIPCLGYKVSKVAESSKYSYLTNLGSLAVSLPLQRSFFFLRLRCFLFSSCQK